MSEKAKNGFREKKRIVIKSLESKQMSGNVHLQYNSTPKVMLPSYRLAACATETRNHIAHLLYIFCDDKFLDDTPTPPMSKREYQNCDLMIKIPFLFGNKMICNEIIPDCLGRL